jgi:hypothetical protein
MELKSTHEIKSAVLSKAGQPEFTIDLALAMFQLITALTIATRSEKNALSCIPENVRNIFVRQ